jgi:hypothetical protein
VPRARPKKNHFTPIGWSKCSRQWVVKRTNKNIASRSSTLLVCALAELSCSGLAKLSIEFFAGHRNCFELNSAILSRSICSANAATWSSMILIFKAREVSTGFLKERSQQIPLCLQFFASPHGVEWSLLHTD